MIPVASTIRDVVNRARRTAPRRHPQAAGTAGRSLFEAGIRIARRRLGADDEVQRPGRDRARLGDVAPPRERGRCASGVWLSGDGAP